MDNNIKKKRRKKNSNKTTRYGLTLQLGSVDWGKVEKIFSNDRKNIINLLDKKEKDITHTSEILKLLAGGAVIALSLAFPVLPMALAPLMIDSNKFTRWKLNHTVKRLKRQNLVKIVYEDGLPVVKITEQGRLRALRYKLEDMEVKKPKVWDRKWRLVIFDIPEKHKRMREIFRNHLKIMGFYMLQKSVWVHPYPCSQEIEFLRKIYNVGINVTYIVAEKIESSDNLKSYFRL